MKRVVVTSSSAAIVNPKKHEKLYDESNWCPITWEEALDPKFTYVGSKVCSILPSTTTTTATPSLASR